MSAEKGPGRAPGASSEASSKVKFRAPSASLDEIAQNFDYDVNPRAVSGAAKITDLLYPDLLARLLDGFFTPGGPWESLRMQLIEHGHAVAPESPKGAKRTETLMAKLLMNTTFSGCEVAIGRAVTRYLNEGIAQFRRLFAEEFDEDGTKMKASDVLRPYRRVTALSPLAVARIIIEVHHVVNIMAPGQTAERDMLSVYGTTGPNAGLYELNVDHIATLARAYAPDLNDRAVKEVEGRVRALAPRRERTVDPDLLPLGNGIFDYRTKRLEPFSPEHVITGKAAMAYDPDARDVAIPEPHVDGCIRTDCVEGSVCGGQTWSVESWMRTLSDDPEIVDLLWQVIGATLRPYVSWNKSAWFYSTRGNNGKGTLVAMMRNLIGMRSCVSLPLSKMGEQFSLQQLAGATAILTDENDVGTYVDKAANLKAITTHDYLMVDRKHKDPISFQFWGFMVQCLNEKPLVSDRSESFYRRQVFIPFEKCFTGIEKKYIKDDFLLREDVLQYVMVRVLGSPERTFMDDYYALDVPASSQKMLDDYKAFNDPVRAFWLDFRESFQWDLLPLMFLYDLFKAWFKEQHPSGRPLAKRAFDEALAGIVEDDAEWTTEKGTRYRSANRITVGEPLIAEFSLTAWTSSSGPRGTAQALMPDLKPVYAGLVRVQPSEPVPDAGDGSVIGHDAVRTRAAAMAARSYAEDQASGPAPGHQGVSASPSALVRSQDTEHDS
ncbi:putative DNA primase/helicase [Brevibacterium sp. Mu109]|nr:putative DNA primase/helicase [Brevibacterium sp. Mu109]